MLFRWVYVTVLAVLSPNTIAQSTADVPQCAEQAAFSSISSTGCQLTDIDCICKDQSFITSLLPIVEKDCSPADLQKTIAFTESLCNSVGITLTISAPEATAVSSGSVASASAAIAITSFTNVPATVTGSSNSSNNQNSSTTNTSPNSTFATGAATPTMSSADPSVFIGVATRCYTLWLGTGALASLILLSLL